MANIGASCAGGDPEKNIDKPTQHQLAQPQAAHSQAAKNLGWSNSLMRGVDFDVPVPVIRARKGKDI